MRSNRYVLTFMSVITIVLGILLSVAATALKDIQERNVQIDMKKNILRSMQIPADRTKKLSPNEIETLYNQYIKEIFVNKEGNDVSEGGHPVFVKMVDGVADGYAIPISGKGLWSTIYGYMAIEPDGATVKGVTFYKHGETPGLGGEIEKEWFTANFIGKKIVTPDGKPCSVEVYKGKVHPGNPKEYCLVDGISGATMTGKGVTLFIKKDLEIYGGFFGKLRQSYQGGGVKYGA
ncbi:MAG: FMN-binding protein [Fidelibacterota bacterium]